MYEVITEPELSDYLHGELGEDFNTGPGAATARLFVELTNGLVVEVIGAAPVTTAMRALALEVAARGFRTSLGYTSVTVSADGTSRTWRREGVTSDGKRVGVYLTRDERAELLAEVTPAPAVPPSPIRMGVPVTWPTC